MTRLARVDWLLAILAGVAALALYVRTLAPTVLGFDSGEFQFAVPILGLVHPTGYPLYLLLGTVVTLLPVGDVAYRVNLFSALAMAGAAGLTVPLALTLLGSTSSTARIAAFAGAALTAVSFDIWAQAVIAEVYGLQMLLLALLALAVVRRWPLWSVALIAGLSLAHHRATILTLPIFAVYLVADQGRALFDRRRLAVAVVAGALPLLLYAYIPLRAGASPYLAQTAAGGNTFVNYQNTPASFIAEVTGQGFSDKLGSDGLDSLQDRVDLFGRLLARQWNPIVLAAAAAGFVLLSVTRWRSALLIGAIGFVTIAFGLLYRIGDIEVYFLAAYWVMAISAGGLLIALGRLPAAPLLAAACALAMVLPATVATLPRADQSGRTEVRVRWEAILATPFEQGAVLASDDRDDMTPLWYFSLVEGIRPDLVGVFPGILNAPEYGDLGRLIDGLLANTESVYLVKAMPGLDAKYQLDQVGPVYRVAGPAANGSPSRSVGVAVGPALRLDGVDLPRQPTDGLATVRLWWTATATPPENYTTFVHLIDANGTLVAQSDAPPGGLFYPSGRWRTGERIVDRHTLRLPPNLPPGRYTVRVGAYGADVKRLRIGDGDAVDVGAIRVAGAPAEPPSSRVDATFAGVGRLDGVTIGQGGAVRLVWTADGPADRPLAVFVHALRADGGIAAQADGPPAGGALPTDSWLAGERLADDRKLAGPAGEYRLIAGLYDPVSGVRSRTTDGRDAVDLGTIRLP